MKQAYQANAELQIIKGVNGFRLIRAIRSVQVTTQSRTGSVSHGGQQRREKFAFPTPSTVKSKEPAFFCRAERVLELYNKCHGTKQQRVTNPVRDWFEQEANQAGWALAMFLADIQASRSAGYMLLAPSLQEVCNAISH